MSGQQFLKSDLGQCRKGDVVEITLTSGANVRLLDQANFNRYRRGEAHRYIGGLAKYSPVRLQVPNNGHWYAVVDMQGLRGSTRASFRKISASTLRPLPNLPAPRAELADIAQAIADVPGLPAEDREFDVFISHASEDKDEVVRPLVLALQERGLNVWYDEFELRVGDSLRRKIDLGISQARFGIVVVSKHFFEKGWPQYELDGLVTLAVTGRQVLLPLWHGVSKEDVLRLSPSLADKVALRTADSTVEEMADEIASVVLDD